MKGFTPFGVLLLLTSSVCVAETFTGKLVDSACIDRQGGTTTPAPEQPATPRGCAPTRSTSTFGIVMSDGRMLRLDSTGNANAAEMVHGGSRSTADSNGIPVTITGTRDGRTVKVENIDFTQ